MISLDRALLVLLLAVLLQAFLHLRGAGGAVWRSNVAAELSLADTLLAQRPSARAVDALTLSAFDALEERKRLVEGLIVQYDAMPWFQRAVYDTNSFQEHADWLKGWRQEWSEKLSSGRRGSSTAQAAPAPSGGLQSAVELAQDAIKTADGDWRAAGMDVVLDEVINLMEAEVDNAFVSSRSCESLRYMAVDEESRTAVGHSIPAILRAMAVNENSSDVQGYCSGTLVHLAAAPEMREAIIHQDGVEAVLRAMQLHPSNAFVHWKACAALANLGATSLEQKMLMTKGAGRELLQSIKTHLHDLSVLEYCLGALHNLATQTENQALLRSSGAVRALRDAVRLYPQHSEVQRVGTKTLRLLKGSRDKAPPGPEMSAAR